LINTNIYDVAQVGLQWSSVCLSLFSEKKSFVFLCGTTTEAANKICGVRNLPGLHLDTNIMSDSSSDILNKLLPSEFAFCLGSWWGFGHLLI
jgi:hypothetical protein